MQILGVVFVFVLSVLDSTELESGVVAHLVTKDGDAGVVLGLCEVRGGDTYCEIQNRIKELIQAIMGQIEEGL